MLVATWATGNRTSVRSQLSFTSIRLIGVAMAAPRMSRAQSRYAMAQDTLAFLESVGGGPAHAVGCSDGATGPLLVALRRADLISRLVLIAGVFHCDPPFSAAVGAGRTGLIGTTRGWPTMIDVSR